MKRVGRPRSKTIQVVSSGAAAGGPEKPKDRRPSISSVLSSTTGTLLRRSSDSNPDVKFDKLVSSLGLQGHARDVVLDLNDKQKHEILALYNERQARDYVGQVLELAGQLSRPPIAEATLHRLFHCLSTEPVDWMEAFASARGPHLLLNAVSAIEQKHEPWDAQAQHILFLLLRCISALLLTKRGLQIVVEETKDSLSRMVLCFDVRSASSRCRELLYDHFALMCNSDALMHGKVMQAMRYYKFAKRERLLFYDLVAVLRGDDPLPVRVSCLRFINTLISAPELLEDRLALRHAFNILGLRQQIREIEKREGGQSEELNIEVDVFFKDEMDDELFLQAFAPRGSTAQFQPTYALSNPSIHVSAAAAGKSSAAPSASAGAVVSDSTAHDEHAARVEENTALLQACFGYIGELRKQIAQMTTQLEQGLGSASTSASPLLQSDNTFGEGNTGSGNVGGGGRGGRLSSSSIDLGTSSAPGAAEDAAASSSSFDGPPSAPMPGHASGRRDNWVAPIPTSGVPLKPVHWERALSPSAPFWSTVKSGVGECAKLVDFSELEESFAAKDATMTPVMFRHLKHEPVLTDKRSNAIEIFLRGTHVDQNRIRDSLLTGILDAETLNFARPLAPLPEEVQAIRALDAETLTDAEKFLLLLDTVPNARQRLEVMHNSSMLEERLKVESTNLATFRKAISQVTSSNRFKRAVEMVITVGNFLNSASKSRRNTAAISVASLPQVVTVRSNSGESLLSYVVRYLLKSSPDTLLVSQDLDAVENASKVSMGNITDGVKQAQSLLLQMQNTLKGIPLSNIAADSFHRTFNSQRIQNLANRCAQLASDLRAGQAEWANCLKSFGQVLSSDEFFGSIYSFVHQLDSVTTSIKNASASGSSGALQSEGSRTDAMAPFKGNTHEAVFQQMKLAQFAEERRKIRRRAIMGKE